MYRSACTDVVTTRYIVDECACPDILLSSVLTEPQEAKTGVDGRSKVDPNRYKRPLY